MATAPRKALSPHDQFIADHARSVAAIDDVKAVELAQLEAATTRAHTAHAKARKISEAEHQAARLTRNAAVVQDSIALFRTAWQAFTVDHGIGRAQILGQHWRVREAVTQRDLGRDLSLELAVAVCQDFISKHPNAKARFANYQDNWVMMAESGICFFAQRAAHALRSEFDLQAMQSALLQLGAVVARVGSAPGYFGVPAEDVEPLWLVTTSCLPPELAEQQRQVHTAAVKARRIAEHQAESGLRVEAARGDQAARDTFTARGPGFLEAILRNAETILRQAGLDVREAVR
jgi:hypothetical protein